MESMRGPVSLVQEFPVGVGPEKLVPHLRHQLTGNVLEPLLQGVGHLDLSVTRVDFHTSTAGTRERSEHL